MLIDEIGEGAHDRPVTAMPALAIATLLALAGIVLLALSGAMPLA